MDQPQAPAGWYPVGGVQRFWDGVAWTQHIAPIAPPQDMRPYAARPAPVRALVPTPYGLSPATQVAPKNPALALLASLRHPQLTLAAPDVSGTRRSAVWTMRVHPLD